MQIEVHGLTRVFGNLKALDNVEFSLSSGRIWGFVGPNGAGKTTTMRIMVGMDLPDSGDVLYDGVSVVQYPEIIHPRVGFMPDSIPSRAHTEVSDYVELFARAHGLRGKNLKMMMDSVMEFTGLDPLKERRIGELSKGMKQRLSLARALVHDPDVLILDEPAAGLDPRARVELRELLKALAERGKTILISSHILTELGEMCDGTIIIEKGRILRVGLLGDVLCEEDSVARTAVIRIIGDPEDLQRILLENPWVENPVPGVLKIEFGWNGADREFADLIRTITSSGIGLVEVFFKEHTLETVFLEATRGELQ